MSDDTDARPIFRLNLNKVRHLPTKGSEQGILCCHALVTLLNRLHIEDMAVIIPFPASRTRGATRARRIFEAQVQLEKARRQATLFFGGAIVGTAFLLTGIELISRLS